MSELDVLHAAALRAAEGTADDAAAALDALPWLNAAVGDDRAAGRFDAWGLSTAIDENTRSPVIARALFEELHHRAGLSATWPVGNAGLLHCYGYLLSLEPTPYGLKRERWLGGDLARLCGLSAPAFLPWDESSTLLSRAAETASALLSETAATRSQRAEGRLAHLALSARSGPAALAYAVSATPTDAPLLITMFPVGEAADVLAEFDMTARLRWNAI